MSSWDWTRAVVCVCDCVLTHLNVNISEASEPIAIKFYLKHHLGLGNAALNFESDRQIHLVSMATDSSHGLIMGEMILAL